MMAQRRKIRSRVKHDGRLSHSAAIRQTKEIGWNIAKETAAIAVLYVWLEDVLRAFVCVCVFVFMGFGKVVVFVRFIVR